MKVLESTFMLKKKKFEKEKSKKTDRILIYNFLLLIELLFANSLLFVFLRLAALLRRVEQE
jgi:hypothetical protein